MLELTSGVLICSTDRQEALAIMDTEGNSNVSKVVKEGGAGRQDEEGILVKKQPVVAAPSWSPAPS